MPTKSEISSRSVIRDLQGPGQSAVLTKLEVERGNLDSALQWSVVHEEDTALELASQAWEFWIMRGYLSTARRWLEQALDISRKISTTRARALRGLSSVAAQQGDVDRAIRAGQDALSLSRELKDEKGMSRALVCLAGAMVEANDVSGARKYNEDGLKIYEKLGDERGIAVSLINLGYIALLEADLTGASRLFHEASAASRPSAIRKE
jgi:tetratricopeptide (TPR) repeat protein